METLVEDMDEDLTSTFKEELEMFYRMSGIFIQMVMQGAEEDEVTIRVEVAQMENYKKMQEMKDFELMAMSNCEEEHEVKQEFSLNGRPPAMSRLPTLGAPV